MEPRVRMIAGMNVATIWRRDDPPTLLSDGEAPLLRWRQPGIVLRRTLQPVLSITEEYTQDSYRLIAAAR